MTRTVAARKSVTMTEEQVIELIRKSQGEKSLREFVPEIGISPSYLSDIYNGTRKPGKKILKHFGISKVRIITTEYRLASN